MRKITELAVSAFRNGETLKQANTEVTTDSILLHGNLIALRKSDGIYITSAGWETTTTKERLNGLGAGIYQRKGVWYWKDGEVFPSNTLVKL